MDRVSERWTALSEQNVGREPLGVPCIILPTLLYVENVCDRVSGVGEKEESPVVLPTFTPPPALLRPGCPRPPWLCHLFPAELQPNLFPTY